MLPESPSDIGIQQDGPNLNCIRAVIELLYSDLPISWNGKGSLLKWLAHSLGLTSLDFFLKGYKKSKVYYMTRCTKLTQLKRGIALTTCDVPTDLLQNVWQNVKCVFSAGLEENEINVEKRS